MSRYLSDGPGMQKYDLSATSFVDQNNKKKKGFSFSGKGRDIIGDEVIGPQRYSITRDFDRKAQGGSYQGQKQSFKFTGKSRNLTYDGPPGPGAYYKEVPTQFTKNKYKGFSLSGRTRVPGIGDDQPAPNRYNTMDSYITSQLPGAKGLGQSAVMLHRHERGGEEETPGPKYNLNSTIGDKNDRHSKYISFGKKTIEIPNKDDIPGPARYNPTFAGETDEKKKKRGHKFGDKLDRGSAIYITSDLAKKVLLKGDN